MIGWIRYKHCITTLTLKHPEELTVAEVAAQFGVSDGVVYYWIERGILPARQQAANRAYWITLADAKAKELQVWVEESKRIAKPSVERLYS